MSDQASPPFATKDGSPVNPGTSSFGGHDFVKDPLTPAGGGPGMIAKDRPQSEAKPEVTPNPESVVSGGAVLKANPGPVSAQVAGSALGVMGGKVPYKGLK